MLTEEWKREGVRTHLVVLSVSILLLIYTSKGKKTANRVQVAVYFLGARRKLVALQPNIPRWIRAALWEWVARQRSLGKEGGKVVDRIG